MTDEEFLQGFEDCSIPRSLWTHAAHVRMAWLYLRRYRLDEVVPIVRTRIRRYNESLGNKTGYHETVTVAYLQLIDHRLDRQTADPTFSEFAEAHPDLLDRSLSALLAHYSRGLLFSTEAIERFVEPDLSPLARVSLETPGG